MNVDGWQPGQPITVDDSAFGYPIRSLSPSPRRLLRPGVLNKYETFHRADGKVVKLTWIRAKASTEFFPATSLQPRKILIPSDKKEWLNSPIAITL